MYNTPSMHRGTPSFISFSFGVWMGLVMGNYGRMDRTGSMNESMNLWISVFISWEEEE